MKRAILAIAVALWAWLPAAAQEAPEGIRAVIAAQIEAFRAGEMTRAFDFASDGIRRICVTPESFGAMIEGGYAMVIDPAEVRFLELRELDGTLWQKVLLKDEAGLWHALDYAMVEERGTWRIDGVQFLRRGEVGA